MICVDRLGTRAGRLGRLAEGAALELKRLGWRVEAAARVTGDAPRGAKRGMTVHALRQGSPDEVEHSFPAAPSTPCSVLGGPQSWAVRHVPGAASGRARLVILPSVTAANEAVVRDSPLGLRSFRELLAASAVVARHTRAGTDARLYADLDVAAVDVPEPVLAVAPAGSLRRRLRLSPALLLLAPSCPRTERDFAMLNALAQAPGDWSLAGRGPACRGACGPRGRRWPRSARRDARVTVADGLGGPAARRGPARGRRGARALAGRHDRADGLAAMAAGVPWIAAPGSAADECCGGLVTPHAGVAAAVHHLLSAPRPRRRARRRGPCGRRRSLAAHRRRAPRRAPPRRGHAPAGHRARRGDGGHRGGAGRLPRARRSAGGRRRRASRAGGRGGMTRHPALHGAREFVTLARAADLIEDAGLAAAMARRSAPTTTPRC